MQAMVQALLAMKETPEPSDAADALAVALCHIQAEQLQRRFGVQRAACRGRKINPLGALASTATGRRAAGILTNQ